MQNAAVSMMMASTSPLTYWSEGRKGSGYNISADRRTAARVGSAAWTSVGSEHYKSSGKWYVEIRSDVPSSYLIAGVGNSGALVSNFVGATSASIGYNYAGNITWNGVQGGTYPALAQGDTVCIAVDATARKIWFRINGAGQWWPSGNPETGVGGNALGVTGPVAPFAAIYAAGPMVINPGSSPFVGALPTGFRPWTAVTE